MIANMNNIFKFIAFFGALTEILAAPTAANKENYLVEPLTQYMKISTFTVEEYASTAILNYISNKGNEVQTVKFSFVLPQGANITNFIMRINGTEFNSSVKEVGEAQVNFEQAVSDKLRAGHITANISDPNRYDVALSIKPQSQVTFHLNYKEKIKRNDNWSELNYTIYPDSEHVMKNYSVSVFIHENNRISSQITKALDMLELNETKVYFPSDSEPILSALGAKYLYIRFSPSHERQKKLDHLEKKGISKQFLVSYKTHQGRHGSDLIATDGLGYSDYSAPSILPPNKSLFVSEPKPKPKPFYFGGAHCPDVFVHSSGPFRCYPNRIG